MKWILSFALLFCGLTHAQTKDQIKPPAKAPAQPFIVVLDPGHPSETAAGAQANGLSENRINWQVANRLGARLVKIGVKVYLTKRSENEKVTNRARAEMANNVDASLLIRLHCDAGGGSGYSWYYPDRAGTKGGVTGPPKSVQIQSKRAAWVLNEAMKPVLKDYLKSNPIKTDAATGVGGKQGGVLTGSIFSKVPTALIEMAFITNKRDAKFIGSAAGQEKMAEALAAGVLAWQKAR